MIGIRLSRERVVGTASRPVGRIDESDDVLLDIDRLKQELFIGRLGGVFA